MAKRRSKIALRGTQAEHHAAGLDAAHHALTTLNDAKEAMRRGLCDEAVTHLVDASLKAGEFVGNWAWDDEGAEPAEVTVPVRNALREFRKKCLVGTRGLKGMGDPVGAYDLLTVLKTVDPHELRFASARYESAKWFKKAVEAAHENDVYNASIAMHEALDATNSDGGSYGVIPTLSNTLQSKFDRATNLAV